MDIKECSYCNKEFSRRDSLTRHLNRCKIKKKNEIENKTEKNKNNEPKNDPFMCLYCNKIFSRNWHLSRHLTSCKVKKKELNKQNNEINLLKLQQKKLEETVEKLLIECSNNKKTSNKTINNKTTNNNNSNNTNTNSNNTIHNTININNYGEENTKYITSDFILNLLKFKPAKVIPELIKHTHFNEAHPENHNIKITNKKGPHIKVMKNNKWEFQNKEETITDLIDRQQMHLNNEDVEEKIEEKCSISEKNNIDRCISLYNSDDKDYMKRLYNDSELIVINNSNK